MPEPNTHQGPWLTIVGIGEDGIDGLSDAARRAIADAEIVFGGKLAVIGYRLLVIGSWLSML